jgi:hypothetical protein
VKILWSKNETGMAIVGSLTSGERHETKFGAGLFRFSTLVDGKNKQGEKR